MQRAVRDLAGSNREASSKLRDAVATVLQFDCDDQPNRSLWPVCQDKPGWSSELKGVHRVNCLFDM
jgi:hypothetical protein